jgi:hypothetical protein
MAKMSDLRSFFRRTRKNFARPAVAGQEILTKYGGKRQPKTAFEPMRSGSKPDGLHNKTYSKRNAAGTKLQTLQETDRLKFFGGIFSSEKIPLHCRTEFQPCAPEAI